MSLLTKLEEFFNPLTTSEQGKLFVSRFKHHSKKGSIWTLTTGCLVYTSLTIYYLISSPETVEILHKAVISFFILGGLTYVVSSRAFRGLNNAFTGHDVTKFLKTANRYIFMVLSFLPGLYFSFHFEEFIFTVYMIYHMITSTYFLYKRFKEFELKPFMLGFGLSFLLRSIVPTIHWFFHLMGSGWFISGLSSTVETIVELGIAVAFMMRLPDKYFPSNMMFGLKILKYLMIFSSWQTWFILMVFATWKNIGSAARAGWEVTFGLKEKDETKQTK